MTKIELALARFRELPPEDQEAIAEIIQDLAIRLMISS
jgi:hypothetical protein